MSDTMIGANEASKHWMRHALTHRYRKGDTIIHAGSEIKDWIAISGGAACVEAPVSPQSNVAVAALWFGDVVGCGSPLGKNIAQYRVTALVDVTTISLPGAPQCNQDNSDTIHLYTATASRLNRQIAMRLAGNGPQRFMSVLATLGDALVQGPGPARGQWPAHLAVPVAQSRLGQLSGLSRRQVWNYLTELAKAGWIQTSRTRVVLQNLTAWRVLQAEVARCGIECISTIESSIDTLAGLGRVARHDA